MYKVEQGFMQSWNQMEETKINFIKNLNFKKVDMTEPSLLIIDDLMLSKDKETVEMFILGSHHRQVSLFFIT